MKPWLGNNELIWNGTYEGEPAPQGEYALTLRLGDETRFHVHCHRPLCPVPESY